MTSEIVEFFRDKVVFITGGTGFMGKALVEKLLRSCQVKQICLLIRAKKGKDVETRLKLLFESSIFEKLKNQSSTLEKVSSIEGDITLPSLGISEENLKILVSDVSIVIHLAANVRFEEPLKNCVAYNVLGIKRVVELGLKLSKLEALLYVSTAYSNSNRREIDEVIYPTSISPLKLIDLCEWMSDEMLSAITPHILGKHPNRYVFTKGLAEQLLAEEGKDLPIAIIRPSIVSGSWREPTPGWVDSLIGITGIVAAAYKGVIRHIIRERNCCADIIPVDISINMMIAIIWATATRPRTNLKVYNCTSGSMNPITWGKVVDLLSGYSQEYASLQLYRYPDIKGTNNKLVFKFKHLFNHLLMAYIFDGIMFILKKKRTMVKTYRKLEKVLDAYYTFLTQEFRFSNDNVLELKDQMNEPDKLIFYFDIRELNWNTYWQDYMLGIRHFIFNEENDSVPKAKRKLRIIYFRDKLIFITPLFVFSILIYYSVMELFFNKQG